MKKLILFIALLAINTFHVHSQTVKTGIEQLRTQKFKQLTGKRVGLISNPTGVDSQLKSTVDILHQAPDVNLVALYAPEHGVRGNFTAGAKISDEKDKLTGLPVYSLYGKSRKPSAEMLKGIDVLLYDIQDIGSRSYTFISTLGLAMEAAAENNIEFIVLDRPNPLGGVKMEGPITEKEFTSFVSQFPIPYIHGLTCGELAQYLNQEKLLKGGVKCKLTVIEMDGWRRSMTFHDTNLPWIPSSPHIPNAETAFFYPASGILGELTFVNIGVGYTMPFQLFAAEWITDADALARNLNNLGVEGIIFRPIYYKPYYGTQRNIDISGVQVHIVDYNKAVLSLVQFYVLQECKKLYPDRNVFAENKPDRLDMFDKVCGTDKVRKTFSQGFMVNSIKYLWRKDIPEFNQKVQKYFLYN